MPKIVLSICIPTYNRAKILSKTLNFNIQCPSKEIEFVVSNNNSPDNTESIVKKIHDPRIKYFRNKSNLGHDSNILKCVKRATGEFLFFLSDEDYIEFESIPWIIDVIKKDKSISLMLGSVGDRRPGKNELYVKQKDELFKAGHESLTKIGFSITYLSGLTLKRESLDLIQAKKYIGFGYIQQVLMFQAMSAGKTLCTSKVFIYLPEKTEETHIVSTKYYAAGKKYYHPLSRISQFEDKIKIINNLLVKFPKVQRILLNKELPWGTSILVSILFLDPINFVKLLPMILRNKDFLLSKSFFHNFLYQIFSKIKRNLYRDKIVQLPKRLLDFKKSG